MQKSNNNFGKNEGVFAIAVIKIYYKIHNSM